ncbi:MAG: GNAT family N-acetyltransferase [Pseudomonadota bacterium]
MRLHIGRADTPAQIEQCMSIREAVFVTEQGVAPELERDGKDGDAIHYLAADDDDAVATARVMVQPDIFKFQRVAVLGRVRGTGVGAAIMRFMMDDLASLPDAGDKRFFLSSQVAAIPFYEKLGFSVCSDEYQDAGIAHRDMVADIGWTDGALPS